MAAEKTISEKVLNQIVPYIIGKKSNMKLNCRNRKIAKIPYRSKRKMLHPHADRYTESGYSSRGIVSVPETDRRKDDTA